MSRPLRPWLVLPADSLAASPEALLGPVQMQAVLVMAGTRVHAAGMAHATDERRVVVFSLSQAWKIGTVHGSGGEERSMLELLPGHGGQA